MAELQNNLPPGWDCRFDRKVGRYYFINHATKTTTWDDPRVLHRPRHGPSSHHTSTMPVEHIALQHGSPELRRNYVYPSQTTPIPAFQIPDHYSPKSLPFQDLGNLSRGSPRGARRIQDSSLSAASNTEEAVAKISAMFPTVSDTHIRVLLKKYHNREALVISALQVEKHPITTPGPFATPPPARNIHPVHATLQMTPPLGIRFGSRGGSPILRPGSGGSSSYASEAYRNSPKPHSPKLKLRYMKSIFPKAEETVILDVLSSNDNNIQKASDVLKEMGFEKRDSAKSRRIPKPEPPKPKEEPKPQVAVAPKIKSADDKKKIKAHLQGKYKDIPEQVITIALESVDFDEDRANQILQIMVQEENNKITAAEQQENREDVITELDSNIQSTSVVPLSQSRQSLKSILKTEKSDYSLKESGSYSRIIDELNDMGVNEYRSSNLTNTTGANRTIVKGANQELLLEDYIKWHGPQPNLHRGPQNGLAKGPNPSLLGNRTYQVCGPNMELRKGPKFGLAKGSIFSQLKDVVVGESRGK